MAITAALVKELRERTGAGMMECKKALVETDGDIEAAIEAMRKAGMAKADKKAGRVAAEGSVFVAYSDDKKKAVLLEINSETDFVAAGDDFKAFGQAAAEALMASGADSIEVLAEQTIADGRTVNQARQELITKIGENIQLRRFETIESEGSIAFYQHGLKIGVLVAYNGGDEALGRDVAMHVAASQPQFLDADSVDQTVLDKEKEILVAQAKDSGKPENIVEKMVEGRIRKFLGEITLLGQPFVKDPDQTVEKLLKANSASVSSFIRLGVGEGIEKKEENFAEEVMAQVKGS